MTRDEAENWLRKYLGNDLTREEMKLSSGCCKAVNNLLAVSDFVERQGVKLKSRQAIGAIIQMSL